jgi:hypothetical protein
LEVFLRTGTSAAAVEAFADILSSQHIPIPQPPYEPLSSQPLSLALPPKSDGVDLNHAATMMASANSSSYPTGRRESNAIFFSERARIPCHVPLTAIRRC